MSLNEKGLSKNMIEFINRVVSTWNLRESPMWTAIDEKRFKDINDDYIKLWSEKHLCKPLKVHRGTCGKPPTYKDVANHKTSKGIHNL